MARASNGQGVVWFDQIHKCDDLVFIKKSLLCLILALDPR
jgi:hypothetical protein